MATFCFCCCCTADNLPVLCLGALWFWAWWPEWGCCFVCWDTGQDGAPVWRVEGTVLWMRPWGNTDPSAAHRGLGCELCYWGTLEGTPHCLPSWEQGERFIEGLNQKTSGLEGAGVETLNYCKPWSELHVSGFIRPTTQSKGGEALQEAVAAQQWPKLMWHRCLVSPCNTVPFCPEGPS